MKEQAEAIARKLPRYVRVNTLVTTLKEQRAKLKESGHSFIPIKRVQPKRRKNDKKLDPRGYSEDPQIKNLLVFRPKGHSDLASIPSVQSGELIIQQKASCFSGLALDPPVGGVVLDACAAPGSKTSHVATLMKNTGTIYAFDRNPARVNTMNILLKQRGITCVKGLAKNFLTTKPTEYPKVTHLMLDPSCSTSGNSTEPHDDPADIAALAENQLAVLKHAMQFPAAEVIVYSTCSIYAQENEQVVYDALKGQGEHGWRLVKALPWWHRRGEPQPGLEDMEHEACVRSLLEDKTIGFFLAKFVREPDAVRAESTPKKLKKRKRPLDEPSDEGVVPQKSRQTC